jgi:uncharacterized membrane protein (DUF485 family)
LPDQPGSENAPPTGGVQQAAYEAVYRSAEFKELRSRFRRFAFPVTGLALAFYFLFVLLAAYAPDFMAEKIAGNINVGLVFGLLQFVMVFAITAIYVRYAARVLDPAAKHMRDRMETGDLS